MEGKGECDGEEEGKGESHRAIRVG
jgi:hypothetical protein